MGTSSSHNYSNRINNNNFFVAYEDIKRVIIFIKKKTTDSKNIPIYLISTKSIPNFIQILEKHDIFNILFSHNKDNTINIDITDNLNLEKT